MAELPRDGKAGGAWQGGRFDLIVLISMAVSASSSDRPFRLTNEGLLLRVKVLAGAGRNQLAGVRAAELAVRIQVPALEGRANRELRRFLADRLGLAVSKIEIITGVTSPHKILRLPSAALGVLRDLLDSKL
jgi:uncharacterized protein (TIGR00251 family)